MDWSYAIAFKFPDEVIIKAFFVGMGGKPILFYLLSTIWPSQKKKEMFTCDVGCGSRPKGDVNVDLLVKDEDPLRFNIQSKPNFIVADVIVPNFIVADARFLPFKNKVFDKTFCFHMIEHVSDDGKAYEEFNRITREEIEIRVPLGIWEDVINTVFWWKKLRNWRKKHHLRSYSKKMLNQTLTTIFEGKDISISYGYLSFLKGLRFECERETRFPFPFPFELVAVITQK